MCNWGCGKSAGKNTARYYISEACRGVQRKSMLQELHIRDFALIDQVNVDFSAGLNVLTGETGAGKSIMIDGLLAVLGAKTGAAAIKLGREKALIEARFSINEEVRAWLARHELAEDDLSELDITREITKSGSKIRVNGILVNVAQITELRNLLITVHAQHEARTLMSGQAQLELLDSRGSKAHQDLLTSVRLLHARRQAIFAELGQRQLSEDERERKLGFARFQLAELEEADVQDPLEDESLKQKRAVLADVVNIQTAINAVFQILSGDVEGESGGAGAYEAIQKAAAELSRISASSDKVKTLSDSLYASAEQINETLRSLRRFAGELEDDPELLQELEDRLAILTVIKRKYGPTLADAMATRAQLEEEIHTLENSATLLMELKQNLAELDSELWAAAKQLSASRKSLAGKLAAMVAGELRDLGMEHCRVEIAVSASEKIEEAVAEIGAQGLDRVDFLIAPNPGQPLSPLTKIASGGELSRIMLALKTIFARADKVSTVVFDEIDTGLSGKTLQSMRDKLLSLACSHQILCITHQPIIAASASNYLHVTKTQSSTETRVEVSCLDNEARLQSLAMMAGGGTDEHSLQFARSLVADSVRGQKPPLHK